jgi:hypothetical protein
MHCPKCGKEFSEGQKFCRTCGANLSIITRAVRLDEAIGRSGRGPLPTYKDPFADFDFETVSGDISEGLEKLTHEIESWCSSKPARKVKETVSPDHRREKYLVDGFKSLMSGIGLMIVLYIVGGVLVVKIPPEKAAHIPIELEPVIRIVWLFGLIPALAGLGQIVAGLFIRGPKQGQPTGSPTAHTDRPSKEPVIAESVTEHTTELLQQASQDKRRHGVADST